MPGLSYLIFGKKRMQSNARAGGAQEEPNRDLTKTTTTARDASQIAAAVTTSEKKQQSAARVARPNSSSSLETVGREEQARKRKKMTVGGVKKEELVHKTSGELARQVNRFSPEELEYLEQKFRMYPTPNLEQREEIARDLSKRRMVSEYESIRGQGWPTELTQVQIKYWFDHQRRKMKKLRMSHSQFTQVGAVHRRNEVVSPSIGSPIHQMPNIAAMAQQVHGQPSYMANALKNPMLVRTSPTGVLPQVNSRPDLAAAMTQGFATYTQPPAAGVSMGMGGVPLTSPVAAAAAAAAHSSGSTPPPPQVHAAAMQNMQNWGLNYLKNWQTLHMITSQSKDAGMKNSMAPGNPLMQFKVGNWQANQVLLHRYETLDKGIFVLNGNLRVLYYGNKDDPDAMPLYSAIVSEGSYLAKSARNSAGGMMIQAQSQCYCALVEQQ